MRQRVDVADQPDVPEVGARLDHCADIADQAADVDAGFLQRQLAGLDLRHVEHRVDDFEQVFAGIFDARQALVLLRRALAPAQQVRHAGDGIDRGPDLVAHVGQEGALRQVGLLRRFLRHVQLIGAGGDQLLQVQAVVLHLGDVARAAVQHMHALGVGFDLGIVVQVMDAAVAMHDTQHHVAVLAGLQGSHVGLDQPLVVGVHQLPPAALPDFLGAVAEQLVRLAARPFDLEAAIVAAPARIDQVAGQRRNAAEAAFAVEQGALGLLACGDIATETHHPAIGQRDGAQRGFHPAAILAAEGDFPVDDVGSPVVLELGFVRDFEPLRGKVADIHGQQFVAAVADECAAGRIDIEVVAILVGDEDALGGGFDIGAETRFRFEQGRGVRTVALPVAVQQQGSAHAEQEEGAGEQDDVAPLFVPEVQVIGRRPADRQDVGQAFDAPEGVGAFDAVRRLGSVEVPLLDARVHDGEELA